MTDKQIESKVYNSRYKTGKYFRHKGIGHHYHIYINNSLYYNNAKHELLNLENSKVINLGKYKTAKDIIKKIERHEQFRKDNTNRKQDFTKKSE